MKKQLTVFLCAAMAVCMMLSLAGCGTSQSTATAASSAPAESEASSVNSIVEATTPQSVADPNEAEEETLIATVLGSSAHNITVMTKDGTMLVFPLVDAEVAHDDGYDENDWVSIEYQGTIVGDDASGVIVNAVTENSDAAAAEAEALTFTDVDPQTLYTTGPIDARTDYKTGATDDIDIDKNTEVTLTGTADYAWNRIEYNGQTYYFVGEYLLDSVPETELTDEDLTASSDAAATKAVKSTWDAGSTGGSVGGVQASSSDTYYTTVNLRMRAAPNTSSQVLGVVKAGTAVGVTRLINNWAEVYYDGGVAYCDFDYLSESPLDNTVVNVASGIPDGVSMQSTDQTMYTTVALHVRASCTTQSAVLGTAPKGTALHVTGLLDNHWVQVQYGGTTGYCINQYLSTTAPAATNQPTIVENNDEVWTISAAHVRSQPSLGGVILDTVDAGYEFTRTGITSDSTWSQVDFNGEVAYVASQYLTTQKPSTMNDNNNEASWEQVDQTVSTTADLRLHSDCSTSAQIYTTMPLGSVVNRVAIGSNGWSQVIYDGLIGYCATEYLTQATY